MAFSFDKAAPDDAPSGDSQSQWTLDPTQQAQLVTALMHNWHAWKQARAKLETTWKCCWNAYYGHWLPGIASPENSMPERSNVNRPVLYEAAETIHSFLMSALLPADEKFFAVQGESDADTLHAQKIEAFLHQKLQDARFYEKYALFLKQAVVIGNSIAAVPWKRVRRTRKVRRPIQLFGVKVGYQLVEEDYYAYDGPDFEVLDMFDVVLDPNQPDFEQTTLIRKVTRSISQVKRCGLYRNLENLGQATQTEDPNKTQRREAFGISSTNLSEPSNQADTITLYEAWGDFWVGDQLFENYVCVVANGDKLIRFEPNPYFSGQKPFVFTTLIPVPNEIYGIGALEQSLGLQHAINTLTNQKLDVINISINNPFTYLVSDDVFDPETVVTRPGALIPVKSHDTLQPINYLNNFTVAFTEIADLKQEINQATGALKLLSGDVLSDSQGRTATEVQALVTGGRQKFSAFARHLENTSLEATVQMVFDHARQFGPQGEWIRLLDETGTETRCQMQAEWLYDTQCQFRIIGSEATLLKSQELAGLMEFARLAKSDPTMQTHVDLPALYRKIYRSLGFRDESSIFLAQQTTIPSPPPKGETQ